MGRSTIGGGGAVAMMLATSLPGCCLGAIEGYEKLSEFETKEMKRFNLESSEKLKREEKLPFLKNQPSLAFINFSFVESLT